MTYEDDIFLDLLFGSAVPVGENLMPRLPDGEERGYSSSGDKRFDELPEDFRRLLAKCGITKRSLRAMAREAIEMED